jgi:hypothetical protein
MNSKGKSDVVRWIFSVYRMLVRYMFDVIDHSFPSFHSNYRVFVTLRSSANAPHRSLPDIPIVETVCDNNSELYATVGDKPQGKSPSNTKKLANISQHSSMSQADDVTSPYARVRSPAHAYDKLKKTEHPYAQVVQPSVAGGVAQVVLENDDDDDEDEDETTIENPISHRESSSNHDLLNPAGSSIDASAAISGRISASQELPYMTPPIMPAMPPPQQHFSGDSQDSSSKCKQNEEKNWTFRKN